MLCDLPDPHGPLLAWLEAQLHEHGAMHWDALRQTLPGHASEELATRLMAAYSQEISAGDNAGSEAGAELRALLDRMLIDRLMEQETLAIEASKSDPKALDRYRALRDRRMQLLKTQAKV